MSNLKALAAVVVVIACTMLVQAQTKVVVTNTVTNPVPIAPSGGFGNRRIGRAKSGAQPLPEKLHDLRNDTNPDLQLSGNVWRTVCN